MTERLYYRDSYNTDFDATVIRRILVGGRPAVVLDRTAFYPESGGQPSDTGLLQGVPVLRVEEDASGDILHHLATPIPSGGVSGKVDWERRFDHMQQHTGQHILSQAFLRIAQAQTLSFHLGRETSTIDLNLAQPVAEIVREAEDLACRIVFENRPIRLLFVEREELDSLGVRKETTREGEIRVIEIGRFDRSPCGGTHVRSSGEVGLIFILGSERYKGGVRIEFACGGRVLKAFRKDHEILRELARLHSAHPHQLPALMEKMLQERSTLLRQKTELENQLLEMEAAELVRQAGRIDGVAFVRRDYRDRTIENLKILAQKVASFPGTIAVFCAVHDTIQLVVARSATVSGDCGAAVQRTTRMLGGKGGGRPELAQAGGIAVGTLKEWVQALRNNLFPSREGSPDPAAGNTTNR
jgi:alanyl-tRNA synthetase